MTYYPLPTPPPASSRRRQQQQEEEDLHHRYHHSTTSFDSIRSVKDVQRLQQQHQGGYDYQQQQHSGGDSVYGERPPSFRSTTNQQLQLQQSRGAGVFLGEEDDDSYRILPTRQREPTFPPRYDLTTTSEGGGYEDFEDIKRLGEFEDSFEGDQSYNDVRPTRRRRIRQAESDIPQEQDDDDDDDDIIRDLNSPTLSSSSYKGGFGAPPDSAHLRRNLTNRRVKLTKGNLVIECQIPTRLSSFLPRKIQDEFLQTRYTAVTCGPEEFNDKNYTLRPSLYNRQTELFIVVTMYNENEELFCRTLHGIMS